MCYAVFALDLLCMCVSDILRSADLKDSRQSSSVYIEFRFQKKKKKTDYPSSSDSEAIFIRFRRVIFLSLLSWIDLDRTGEFSTLFFTKCESLLE